MKVRQYTLTRKLDGGRGQQMTCWLRDILLTPGMSLTLKGHETIRWTVERAHSPVVDIQDIDTTWNVGGNGKR